MLWVHGMHTHASFDPLTSTVFLRLVRDPGRDASDGTLSTSAGCNPYLYLSVYLLAYVTDRDLPYVVNKRL